MTKKSETKERILKAALHEFSLQGLKGARVENISRQAGVNKAMIFYYYSSKQQLYEEVLNNALKKIFIEIAKKILLKPTVSNLIDKIPQIHITFFRENPEFIKMMGYTLFQDPDFIRKSIKKTFAEKMPISPSRLLNRIKRWFREGKITESDPLQFMINIISLTIFVFVAKPIVETIFDVELDKIEDFYDKRIDSVRNILKRGMLS
jgi:AcrR family transcriptional regulator